MNKLTYDDLLKMNGKEVIVNDYRNNILNQKCEVIFYSVMHLKNDTYDFVYDECGICIDGDFEVTEMNENEN